MQHLAGPALFVSCPKSPRSPSGITCGYADPGGVLHGPWVFWVQIALLENRQFEKKKKKKAKPVCRKRLTSTRFRRKKK